MQRVPLLIVAFALVGCGDPGPLPMAATPDSSRTALVAALDGWKGGKTFKDLLARSPSLSFTDEDLNRGSRLLDYKIEGEGRPRGTGYGYVVTLKTRDGAAAPVTKKVLYTAVTTPKHAVTREDRKP